MIIDHLKNTKLYYNLGSRIKTALKYIEETDFDKIKAGKYEIDGENIFVIINDYETKNRQNCKLEGHQKYIDLQFIAKGSELMGYANLNNQKTSTKYNTEDDYAFFEGEASYTKVDENMFAIFFPSDLHLPGIYENKPSKVKKIVVKIKIKVDN